MRQVSDNFSALVLRVAKLLSGSGKSIAVAESCTGGMLSAFLTSVSGSSAYFIGGIVAYQNSAKEEILGVPGDLIVKHGAVSSKAALSMAHDASNRFHSDIGIGITGIAGPTGGSPEKPVGLVYVAIHLAGREDCREFYFQGKRNQIRKAACREALKLLLEKLS